MTELDLSIAGRRWREVIGRGYTGWPVSMQDWERRAFRSLEPGPRDYIFGGAGSGSTIEANRDAFGRWALVPRMLATPAIRDLSVSLFGRTHQSPIILAPIGVLSIAHPDADLAVASAAEGLGIAAIMSTAGSVALETITDSCPDLTAWFQLYWVSNRQLTASFVARAEASGYEAIVVTVDTPMLGWRESDLANAYSPFSSGHGIAHFLTDPVFRSLLEFDPATDVARAGHEMMKLFVNPGLGWEDLKWLRSLTDLPILLKGALHPDDALRTLDAGLNGIIVSNHGGRQVDGSIAALDALIAVRAVVPAETPVLLDGGIRGGADVVKAMALGASAVLVGRPYVYGLIVGGREGVHEVLSNLLADTDSVLALTGHRDFQELNARCLVAGGR